jgi:hypothetical protein
MPKSRECLSLLICDGHNSHITSDFLEHFMDNIILAYSSHLTQPLDISMFGALKNAIVSMMELLL